MTSLSSLFPDEILDRILKHVNWNGDIAAMSCVDSRSYQVAQDIMAQNAIRILHDATKKQDLNLYQFLHDKYSSSVTTPQAMSEFFSDIVAKARSLNLACSSRILEPHEVSELSKEMQVIEDKALKKIWPAIADAINLANPGLHFGPFQTASEMRGWLKANAAILKNVLELDLSQMNLKAIPSEIGLLTSLQTLNISQNLLRSLPLEIGNLKHLKHLDISENQIELLPPQISEMKSLSELLIANNLISEFPVKIGQLSCLEILIADSNKIANIPSEIGVLSNLKTLSFANNRIKTVSKEISNLKNLQQLDLSNNQVEMLTKEICGLRSLQYLNLKRNKLREVPMQIGLLTELQYLLLQGNQLIEFIPSELPSLKNLKEIDLSDNQLLAIHPHVGKLKSLSKLNLQGNLCLSLDAKLHLELYCLNAKRSKSLLSLYMLCSKPILDRAKIKNQFLRLTKENDSYRCSVYFRIWEQSGMPETNDENWGETHAFESIKIFQRALFLGLYDVTKDSFQNSKIFEVAYRLAKSPKAESLESWVDGHIGDDPTLLLGAWDIVQNGIVEL